jgi:hypothetical protein
MKTAFIAFLPPKLGVDGPGKPDSFRECLALAHSLESDCGQRSESLYGEPALHGSGERHLAKIASGSIELNRRRTWQSRGKGGVDGSFIAA